MGKHEKEILGILSKNQLKSTNEILKELEEKSNKSINWHYLYRRLLELTVDNKAERIEAKAGFFWKKK